MTLGGFSYYRNPFYRKLEHEGKCEGNRELHTCLVSFGQPGDSMAAQLSSFLNSRHKLGTPILTDKQPAPPLLFAFYTDLSKQPNIDGPELEEDEWKSLLAFYLDALEAAADRLATSRIASWASKALMSKGHNLSKEQRKRVVESVSSHIAGTRSPLLIEGSDALEKLTQNLRTVLRQAAVDLDIEVSVDDVSLDRASFPRGLIVASEYAFPSFAFPPIDSDQTFQSIVDRMIDIANRYQVFIHGGTLNDCYSSTKKHFGYAYGVLVSPSLTMDSTKKPSPVRRIFKNEHAMSGRRKEIFEGFISHPPLPSVDVFATDFGYTGFPICADFISTRFDDVFGYFFREHASKNRPLDYLFVPSRDFSSHGSLYRKLTTPLYQWHYTDKLKSHNFKAKLKRFPMHIGFVNCLEGGAQPKIDFVSKRFAPQDVTDEMTIDGANLQAIFAFKDANAVELESEGMFVHRKFGDSNSSTEVVEEIKTRKEAVEYWAEPQNRRSMLAAYLGFSQTSVDIPFDRFRPRHSSDID